MLNFIKSKFEIHTKQSLKCPIKAKIEFHPQIWWRFGILKIFTKIFSATVEVICDHMWERSSSLNLKSQNTCKQSLVTIKIASNIFPTNMNYFLGFLSAVLKN
jgi:hypothetical protein